MLLNKEDSVLALVDVQEKLAPAVWNYDAFIARCEWLLKLAQRMAVPVITSEQYPKGLGATVEELRPYFHKNQCIEKIHFSCMQQPDYIQHLRKLNKNQLIVTGIEAHVCVLQTAMEMKGMGFDVYVVADAVSSRSENDLKYALKRMKQEGIQLITAEMVFFEWLRKAGGPEFKELSKEFLQ